MAVAHQFEDRPVSIRVGDFELRVAESPGEIEAGAGAPLSHLL